MDINVENSNKIKILTLFTLSKVCCDQFYKFIKITLNEILKMLREVLVMN